MTMVAALDRFVGNCWVQVVNAIDLFHKRTRIPDVAGDFLFFGGGHPYVSSAVPRVALGGRKPFLHQARTVAQVM